MCDGALAVSVGSIGVGYADGPMHDLCDVYVIRRALFETAGVRALWRGSLRGVCVCILNILAGQTRVKTRRPRSAAVFTRQRTTNDRLVSSHPRNLFVAWTRKHPVRCGCSSWEDAVTLLPSRGLRVGPGAALPAGDAPSTLSREH